MKLNFIHSDTQQHIQWHSTTHTATLNYTHSDTQLHTWWHSTTSSDTQLYTQWHSTLHTQRHSAPHTVMPWPRLSLVTYLLDQWFTPCHYNCHDGYFVYFSLFSDLKPWRAVCQYSDLGESVLEYDVLTQWYANIFANIRKNLKICIMANSLFFQETLKQNVQPD